MKHREVGPDVWLYEDVLPLSLCRRVIDAFEAQPDKEPVANRTEDGGYQVFRNADVVDFLADSFLYTLAGEVERAMGRAINHHLYDVHRLTPELMPWYLRWLEVCCYRPPLGRCAIHMDGAPGVHPVVTTAVAYLNTMSEGDGGETVFPRPGRERIEVRPIQGAVLIFPPGYTHMHGANPVRAERYFVNTRVLFRDPQGPAAYGP